MFRIPRPACLPASAWLCAAALGALVSTGCLGLGGRSAQREFSVLRESGRYAEAEVVGRELLQAAEKRGEPREIVQASLELGDTLLAAGNAQAAGPIFERAAEMAEADLPADLLLADALHGLANARSAQSQLLEAQQLFARALAVRAALAAADSDVAAQEWLGLADMALRRSDLAPAQDALEHALALQEHLAATKPERVARTLERLGSVLLARGQYPQAKSAGLRALTLWSDARSPLSEQADALTLLGRVYLKSGIPERAGRYFEEALGGCELTLGSGHPATVRKRRDLAAYYGEMGRRVEARNLYRSSLIALETRLGLTHPDVGEVLIELAGAEEATHEPAEAERHLARALPILQAAYGLKNSQVVAVVDHLARLRKDTNGTQPVAARGGTTRRIQIEVGGPDTAR